MRIGVRNVSDPLPIEVGEPIKIVDPAPPFKVWIIRGWSRGGWRWYHGWWGREKLQTYDSEAKARSVADDLAGERDWNPVLVIPIEYKGEGTAQE
jgi:hypothetical protein